ncbi:MAG: aldehyde dehydrogenase family protein, partial [Desulfobulbaceae bacterium]|nr:aldehyde dehydrogenase family protein [Desulfobulbaceae bacterium]
MSDKNPIADIKHSELFRESCYIGGQWVKAESGAFIDVLNPANGSVIGRTPACGQGETARAIRAAEKAQPAWRELTAKQRSDILKRWYELIMNSRDDLALIMTAEQGKPLAEAKGEISYGASYIEWFAEESKR